MEEEVTQRTIALSIRTAKLTGNVLRAALRKFLAAQHQKGKNPYKQGKQTVKELIGQNAGVSNIEINDGNIKSFERVAKKYGIDYALKKDKSCIFRKNCASVPEERSAIPLQTEQSSAG